MFSKQKSAVSWGSSFQHSEGRLMADEKVVAFSFLLSTVRTAWHSCVFWERETNYYHHNSVKFSSAQLLISHSAIVYRTVILAWTSLQNHIQEFHVLNISFVFLFDAHSCLPMAPYCCKTCSETKEVGTSVESGMIMGQRTALECSSV